MIRVLLQNKLFKFCIVGSISTVIDVTLLFVLIEFFHLGLLVGVTVALLIASINGYTLNRIFTFKNASVHVKTQYLQYLTVSLVGLLLTLLCMSFLITNIHMYYVVAKVVTVFLVLGWNFTVNYVFVFKSELD